MIRGRRTREGGGKFHGKEGRVLHRHTILEHGMLDLVFWREALQLLPSDSMILVERVGSSEMNDVDIPALLASGCACAGVNVESL